LILIKVNSDTGGKDTYKMRPTIVEPIAVGESNGRRSTCFAANGEAKHCGQRFALRKVVSLSVLEERKDAVWIALALLRSEFTTPRMAGTTFELVVIWSRAERKYMIIADRGLYVEFPMANARVREEEALADTTILLLTEVERDWVIISRTFHDCPRAFIFQ
jgi:hypothetical protein